MWCFLMDSDCISQHLIDSICGVCCKGEPLGDEYPVMLLIVDNIHAKTGLNQDFGKSIFVLGLHHVKSPRLWCCTVSQPALPSNTLTQKIFSVLCSTITSPVTNLHSLVRAPSSSMRLDFPYLTAVCHISNNHNKIIFKTVGVLSLSRWPHWNDQAF